MAIPLRVVMLAVCSVLAVCAGDLRLHVKDASGAVVQASGWAENTATGTRRNFRTDSSGAVSLGNLEAGSYKVRIARQGFATFEEVMVVGDGAAVDREVRLSLGTAAFAVSVVSSTPLAGLDRPLDEIPAPVQTATDREMEASGALDVSDYLNRRLNNVFVNEIQGNPLQADVNYRGYTASPLLGTPQGISIYLDGVRMNQPFGDVASWDLIPRTVVSEVALIPGSNPLFGLNTLGGALSLRTKDGVSHAGTRVQLSGGSFGRMIGDFEHGGSAANGLNWFAASNLFFEDGWRETSASNVRQFFGKLGWQGARTSIGLSMAYANNGLLGNGLQEPRFLARDYSSVYTKPDLTAHRAPYVNLSLRHGFTPNVTFSGNAYFRYIRTTTMNGDINEDSLDQSMYQPGAAERAALAAAGYSGFPVSGATAENTPFPFWRCLGNVLLRDEPGEKCNGLLNRTGSHQRNYGVSGQVSWFGRGNTLAVGGGYDGNSTGFTQSSELGYLNPDRTVSGTGAYADGVTGGDVDGEPFDTRVNLSGRVRSSSVFVTDTVTRGRFVATLSGRFNHTRLENLDLIRPLAGTGSLTGVHSYNRFNPAVGATYRLNAKWRLYGSVTEGNRAPTSIELGCADPNAPCRLPNALAGDPPLQQVVTRTFEAGVRGRSEASLSWSAGWFRAPTRDDILFVASEQTGFGYFKNFGRTLRQGAEFSVDARVGRATLGGGYTLLDATFQSSEHVNGAGNSTNEEALKGLPGVEGTIAIRPGNRIPLTPKHMVKAHADVQVNAKLSVHAGVVGMSSAYARGNENNQHRPDGRYYIGEGESPGYGVVNLGGSYQVRARVQLFAQVNNLFDRRYYTGAQLGPTGFTSAGAFVARPFAAVQGEFPVLHTTFFAPGAPRGAWGGIRIRF
ncbi:MAG: TonB-dependent receptor [Bryobacteraceae bacterium]